MPTLQIQYSQRPVQFAFFDAARRLVTSVLIIPAVLFCNCAFAADWSFSPSVTVSETYNSNLTFSSTSGPGVARGDFITSLKPVLSVTGETEDIRFQFDTITTGLQYFENPSLDTIYTDTKASLTELWSQRFSTDENFRFLHDYTLENELESSGIITQMAERYQYNAGLGCKYGLADALDLIANGVYTDTIYPSHQASLPNYTVYQGAITPVWAITPRNNLGFSSNYYAADYPQFSASLKTITEMFYWERFVTETLNFRVSAGYYYTSSSFVSQVLQFVPPSSLVVVTKPGTASDSGPALAADIKEDWTERFSTTLMASKQQYDDPYARSFDKTSVGVTAKYGLTELTTVNFRASYDMNDQTSSGTQKIDYLLIGPSIERNLSENLIGRLSGSYELESYTSSGPPTNIDRYRTWVELIYKWPRLLASH
jgi:hypothetical protein